MPSQPFDKDAFLRSAVHFKARLKHEQEIVNQVEQAMSLLGDAAIQLVALSHEVAGDAGPLLTATVAEGSIHITGSDRNLLFGAAQGVGNDSCLPGARLEPCGQILVFGHLTGHGESHLLTSVRVYSNGDVTDGNMEWSNDDGVAGVLPYLSHILRTAVFEQQLCWPSHADMPEHLQRISLTDERPPEESLRKPCFGFGCPL